MLYAGREEEPRLRPLPARDRDDDARPRVAVIADDLTGALDAASPFACRGWHVLAALDSDYVDEAITARPDVVAVSTNSRGLPEDHAASRARDAAERLRAWRPELVLKKIDSRLKGNIASEAAALAEIFRPCRICVSVAVPEQGRLVRNGFLEGKGVDGRRRVADELPSGPVAVRDAVSDDDLDRTVADWCVGDDILFVCARGLAAAFARRLAGPSGTSTFVATQPVMLAVGSRDPITQMQVAELLAAAGDAAMVEAPGGRLSERRASGHLTVFACTGPMDEPSEAVARVFAESIAAEVAHTRPATLLVTGGDTAFAVFRVLGVRTLRVRGEAAAGLPWFEIPAPDGGRIAAVSKSGGFGSADVLLRVLDRANS